MGGNLTDWGKKEKKLSFFTDDMNDYVENPKEQKYLLELVSSYSKIRGYGINIQKSIPFLDNSNE